MVATTVVSKAEHLAVHWVGYLAGAWADSTVETTAVLMAGPMAEK